ncbi:glutathionylspermidine synthase family protein [Rossellomorea aquimaris]|uniref:glutathionylspermidine synthase family protein n=1 Tax=Rossellomorea aquimaris TaxID=189382 RepID=UPI001CD511A8|nr:glutathionylspermidine synthase family protein [Rossellomorea aquimaris]MCA1054910.1 glutathionylspermidine synthase family protein [Rossellomorea aquimaris]
MAISHREKRNAFYKEIPDFWHDLFGMEYALLDVKKEKREVVTAIRDASEKVYNVYRKTADLLRELSDESLLELGFPEESLSYLRIKSIPQECIVGRFDFVMGMDGGVKLLEFNSDTPTFIKELFHVNGKVCEHFSYGDPNADLEAQLGLEIRRALLASWRTLGRDGSPKIVFSSHSDHEEDHLTTRYLQSLAGVHSEFVSLDELQIRSGREAGVYTPSGERIDVLYRPTYPIEHLVDDADPDTGERVGQELMELVLEGKVAVLNPPSAFLMQSKGVQALIWGLHESGSEFYSEEEHEWISSFFLPTYLDPDVFEETGTTYVQKPAFGREGDTVKIIEASGRVVLEDPKETYKESLPVYQQYIELPRHGIRTDEGVVEASLMAGSFVINGVAGAVGYRAGNAITDNESYFLPIGVEED